ncbi:hypothetical protein KR009_000867, partial [Drosophila setifemur]
CTNIPELFLDKYVARSHFSRFGNLVNFVLRPRRMTCTVSYATEEEAETALLEGDTFNGHRFGICFADNESSPAQKTEEWVDPDVQAELSALSAGWRSEYPPAKVPKAPNPAPLPAPPAAQKNPPSSRERPGAHHKELENLLRRPAMTAEERYRVLDARDKLLRLNQIQKQARDLQNSGTATQGHCPDMCPEKERVLREFQRQVAVYELQPGSDEHICHERAVKQYSRSSADQETPLPHELRNEKALHMTMSYLMHEIMDIRESSHLGDWFHFVWDRTRSIRKEITQQELCSLGAVKLVEQCARFHIHCAARLVGADPSVFDSKINAENLTKCLQTLKYMYHDLRLKGVQCPREAEFRGYIVLLNLADANFLWDIGQLPAELQSCPEIRQAIQFYLALQDTNFVRFFKLLREEQTSYLSACILVTYFPRLRVLALHRLIQAYRAPRKNEVSSLPLAYVTEMLGCGSQNEAAHFVRHYGLEVNRAGRVVLTRMHTVEADYKLDRQLELVESKRQQSVGECICGEPLPPRDLYLNHRPHNSFNEHGVLKSVAWSAKDQLPGMSKEEVQQSHSQSQQKFQKDQAPGDNFFKVPMQPSSGMTIFGGPPPAAVPAAAQASISGFSFVSPKNRAQELHEQAQAEQQQRRAAEEARRLALEQAIAVAKQREAELMAIQAAKAAEAQRVRQQKIREREEQEEQQRRQQQQQEQEEKQRQREEAERLQLERERQQKLEQLRHVERQQREARLKEQTLQMYGQLFGETLDELCRKEVQLHKHAVSTYNSLLDTLTHQLAERQMQQSAYEMGLMRVYWRRWRNYRGVQQHKDTLFNQLPLSFGAEAADRLLDERCVEDSLRLMRRYRQGEACDFRRLLAGMEEQSWLKLDLWRVLEQCLPQHQPGARRFFKLIISLPDGQAGLQLEYDLDRGLLQQPQSPDARQEQGNYIRGLSQGIALSVVKISGGYPSLGQRKELLQADGIICLAGVSDLKNLPQRLKLLIQASGCHDVALILQHPSNSYPEPQLPLEELGVRQWRVFLARQSGNTRQRLMTQLQHAVKFLASGEEEELHALQQTEVREWVIENMGQELFRRLKYTAEQDVAIGRRCERCPQYCADLYNEAVRRLQLVAGEDLSDCRQLPEELRVFVDPLEDSAPLATQRLEYFEPGWKLPAPRQRIVQLLELAKLPKMPPLPERREDRHLQEEAQCQWVLDYAQLSQEEELVEAIAMQAITCLQSGEDQYIDFVQLLAGERLQYILRRELELPRAIVYRVATMKRHFLSAWFYEFQKPEAEPPQQHPELEPDYMEESIWDDLDHLDFEAVVNQAEIALGKCRKRQEERQTLKEINGSSEANTQPDQPPNQNQDSDSESLPKRQ